MEACSSSTGHEHRHLQVDLHGQVQPRWHYQSLQGLLSCSRLYSYIWHRLQGDLLPRGTSELHSSNTLHCSESGLDTTSVGRLQCISLWRAHRPSLYGATTRLCNSGIGRPGLSSSESTLWAQAKSPRMVCQIQQTCPCSRTYSICKVDPTVFCSHSSAGTVILAVNVDDILLTGSYSAGLSRIKAYLHQHLTIRDLGTPKYFLGIEFAH